MARGRVGRAKRTAARKAYRVLTRARLPKRVSKAGANRVGQVFRLGAGRRRRRSGRRMSMFRRRRY